MKIKSISSKKCLRRLGLLKIKVNDLNENAIIFPKTPIS